MQKESDKTLEQRLDSALARIALATSNYGAVDGKWNSSAQNFEKDLLEHGIKLPHGLFYKYALPENMTHQEFMEKLAVLNMQRDLDRFDIKGHQCFFQTMQISEHAGYHLVNACVFGDTIEDPLLRLHEIALHTGEE